MNEFAAGVPVSISFPQTGGSTGFPDPTGGLISSFTSYGPTNDMFFKPAVAAPGGNILSTFPVPLGSFAVLSGTSMATPFIAGVGALLFGVKGNSAAVGKNARNLFETTAQLDLCQEQLVIQAAAITARDATILYLQNENEFLSSARPC